MSSEGQNDLSWLLAQKWGYSSQSKLVNFTYLFIPLNTRL